MPDVSPFPTTITAPLDFNITPEKEALYAVFLIARCRGANNDLRVEFDGRSFRELPPTARPSLFDIPPAWNGSLLKGQTQTTVLILWLAPIKYTLTLIPRGRVEILEPPRLVPLPNPRAINLALNNRASAATGQPWCTLALVDLPLKSCGADVSVRWHWRDGDDVKLIIDGAIQRNPNTRLLRDWLWSARPWPKPGPKRENKNIGRLLPRGIHYLEFWADHSPTLHTVSLDLGTDQRLPSREAPRWTGNSFSDDTDQLLLARMIFGEARGVVEPFKIKARTAVGWTVRNRIALGDWRGKTYREVILKEAQYSAFNINERNKENRLSVENPLRSGSIAETKAWLECYEIAGQIIDGSVVNPVSGATNYYDESIVAPSWAIKENFKVKIGPLFFYRA